MAMKGKGIRQGRSWMVPICERTAARGSDEGIVLSLSFSSQSLRRVAAASDSSRSVACRRFSDPLAGWPASFSLVRDLDSCYHWPMALLPADSEMATRALARSEILWPQRCCPSWT